MGEAKRRGTFEKRKAMAIEKESIIRTIEPLPELKPMLNMNYLSMLLNMAEAENVNKIYKL